MIGSPSDATNLIGQGIDCPMTPAPAKMRAADISRPIGSFGSARRAELMSSLIVAALQAR